MMLRNLPLDLLPLSVNVYRSEGQDYGTYVRYVCDEVSIIGCYTQEVAEHLAAEYSERLDVAHSVAITTFS